MADKTATGGGLITRYAMVAWTSADVLDADMRHRGVTASQAEDWLDRHASTIRDAVIQRGNDVIDDLLRSDPIIGKEEE